MKTSNKSFVSKLCPFGFSSRLAALAALATLALGTYSFVPPIYAGPPAAMSENTQTANLLQLAADFHGALSYGGDITAMMSLWADNSTFTFNGTPHDGKPAIQAFFLSAGYFLNNWVSLAPEYKTQVTLHGNTAHISTQCVAVDLSVSPMVVKSVIQVEADAVRHGGKWLFISMNNTTPAPL